MSRTAQNVAIPKTLGGSVIYVAASASGAGNVKITGDTIEFIVGPCLVGSRFVHRNVLVQSATDEVPSGYKRAGEVVLGNSTVRVLVEFPE